MEKLAGEAGVELPKWSPEDEAREKRKKSLYDIVELAAAFYEAQLFGDGGRAARDYLQGARRHWTGPGLMRNSSGFSSGYNRPAGRMATTR